MSGANSYIDSSIYGTRRSAMPSFRSYKDSPIQESWMQIWLIADQLDAPILIFRGNILVDGDRAKVCLDLRGCPASARCPFRLCNMCFVQIYGQKERGKERSPRRKRCVWPCFFALPTSIQKEIRESVCMCVLFEGKKTKGMHSRPFTLIGVHPRPSFAYDNNCTK